MHLFVFVANAHNMIAGIENLTDSADTSKIVVDTDRNWHGFAFHDTCT